MGEKRRVNLAFDYNSHVNHRVLLHATNLRHGTDGFTSPPKEGMLYRIEPGFELAILGTRGQHANHKTTKATERDGTDCCNHKNILVLWLCVCVCVRGRTLHACVQSPCASMVVSI
jgi:hypothetical protein